MGQIYLYEGVYRKNLDQLYFDLDQTCYTLDNRRD